MDAGKMMNRILMIIMATGAIVGGIDRIAGNKLGYGKKFEEGFMFLGPTALSMAGMICLAPVLAKILGAAVVPVYRAIGVDPGMFGSFLAIDMGGYQLACALAEDSVTGNYAGIVVAAVFGCTVVFTIPVGMGMIDKWDRNLFARGIMLGFTAMPAGLIVGGLIAGLSAADCLHQNLPVLFPAFLLFIGLWKIPEKMIRGFCIFATGIKAVITAGLVLAAVEYMCGFNPVKGMAPLEEAMGVVSSVGIVMLGSLPLTEFLQSVLKRPFTCLGRHIGMGAAGMTGLLAGMVSPVPAIAMFKQMDDRSKVINAAFLVSAASMFAAHMGFTVSTAPEMLGALLGGKLCGALAAVILAAAVTRSWTEKNV